MRLRLIPYLLPVIGVAGLVLLPGYSSAPAQRAITVGSNTASSASLTTGGNIHLTAYTDNDGPTTTVVVTGAVGDYGKGQRVDADGSGLTQLDLVLRHGSFRLDITDLDKRFLRVLSNLPVNTGTCSATASVSAPVPVVAGSGTGSYKGIRGVFHLGITLDEVYQPDACNESGAYLSQSIVITGPGVVSLH